MNTKIFKTKKDNHNHCCSHDHSHESNQEELVVANDTEIISTFKVSNMDCADEIKAINDILNIDKVSKIQANLMSSSVTVLHHKSLQKEEIIKLINRTVVQVINENTKSNFLIQYRKHLVIASGLFLIIGIGFDKIFINQILSIIFYLAAILTGGSLIFPKAFSALKRKSLDMNVLMMVAVIGAIIIQEYIEAASVVFLFSLSELLESLSIQKARKAIGELLNIAPSTCNVLINNEIISKNVNEIIVDEIIRVRAGENIPLDGHIINGSTSINQAPLTGESTPVNKSINDIVLAGTINLDGLIDIRVSSTFQNSKLSNIIRLVENAQTNKAKAQKFVDVFARYYTPFVLIVAILTFIIPSLITNNWSYWFYKSLVLLIIACPCALVISTPVTIVSGLTALARKGILVKGGVALENLGKINSMALDKTGTLTYGNLHVKEIVSLSNMVSIEILKIASSIELNSNHPIAKAIVNFSIQKNIDLYEVADLKNLPGQGMSAIINGEDIILGNYNYISSNIDLSNDQEFRLKEYYSKGLPIVFLANKTLNIVLGLIILEDQLKEDAKIFISNLYENGIKNISILSGDNFNSVKSVANAINVKSFHSDLMPDDKLKIITSLKSDNQIVAMIGDGINDAPSLAVSDIGISMGGIGSDIAIEASDVVIMNDNLSSITNALKIGRRSLNIIKFNITFALLTKLIFFILTFLGFANLWLAILADTGASIFVILNSLRLLTDKD